MIRYCKRFFICECCNAKHYNYEDCNIIHEKVVMRNLVEPVEEEAAPELGI